MNQATFKLRLEDEVGMRKVTRREVAFHGEQHVQWLSPVLRAPITSWRWDVD